MQAPIAEVKKRLCELVDRVEAGETVIILRHGKACRPAGANAGAWQAGAGGDSR